ncbi:MAG TPA: hypothetical protein VJM33_08515 [Microthrixaceae bacterium]|nr:hypothetical protein [Microthrixaceae bacterium]
MKPLDLLASDRQMDALARGDEFADPELVRLIRAAQGPSRPDELAGKDQAVSMLVTGGTDIVTSLTTHRRGRLSLAAKSAVVVGAIFSVGAAAAAATGVVASFGDPVTPVVSTSANVAEGHRTSGQKAGSSTPVSPSHSSTSMTVPTSSTVPDPTARASGAVGPNPDGPARHGLCTAFGARESIPGKSVAAENLAEAATAAGQTVDEFCAAASSTDGPTTRQKSATHESTSAGGTPNEHANPAAGGSSNANPSSIAGDHGGQTGASNPSPSAGGTPNEHANPAAGGSSNANPDSNIGDNGQ